MKVFITANLVDQNSTENDCIDKALNFVNKNANNVSNIFLRNKKNIDYVIISYVSAVLSKNNFTTNTIVELITNYKFVIEFFE